MTKLSGELAAQQVDCHLQRLVRRHPILLTHPTA